MKLSIKAARLAGDLVQCSAFSHGTRAFLRRDKERHVREITEEMVFLVQMTTYRLIEP